MNAYFAFRVEFLKGLAADEKHKTSRADIAFADLSAKEKEKLENEYQKKMDKWRVATADWRKQYGIKDPKERTKSKSVSKSKSKADKSKGKDKKK